MVLCGFQTKFKSSLAFVLNDFGYAMHKIEQTLTSNFLFRYIQRDTCRLKRRNLITKLATCRVVLCVFQTRSKRSLALVLNDFRYVIPAIEQTLTSNIFFRAVQRDIRRLKRRNLIAKLVTFNVVLWVPNRV